MTRSLCQEVTKNWHSIPSNRTTACSGSNVSVDLGIVSLTLGNSGLPLGDCLSGNTQFFCQFFLGPAAALAQHRDFFRHDHHDSSFLPPERFLPLYLSKTLGCRPPSGRYFSSTSGCAFPKQALFAVASVEIPLISSLFYFFPYFPYMNRSHFSIPLYSFRFFFALAPKTSSNSV